MSWYENLNRSIPYMKQYRSLNLWYDYNNGKHREIVKPRTLIVDYWIQRFFKHEAHSRLFYAAIGVPCLAWLVSVKGRFAGSKKEEQEYYSGAQFVASIGRNSYGFETRAPKTFEHCIGVLLGKEVLGHILSQDSDILRQDEIEDENDGLTSDFSNSDMVDLRKEPNHTPHFGIVYLRPERHYLNAKPSDELSPYVTINETKQ